jgi:prophage antirepressor-like protein
MATINENEFNSETQICPGASTFNSHNLEYLNKILNYNNKTVRIFGTNEDPWFCSKDICEILEYANYRDALFKFVDDDNKKSLKVLGVSFKETPKITHNEGQMCYINEEGLYSLIFACKLPLAKLFKKWVMKEVLPSIRKTGQYKLQEQLADAMKNLEIKDQQLEEKDQQLEEKDQQLEENQQQLEENQKQLDEAKSKLRSETSKLKNQLRKTLEFNQATKKIEPTEYIYIVTTSQYQKTNKFKVGGCQSFDLIKSRLNQYNSGESDSHNHFFVYLRKTVSYKSIEHAISGMLMGFRENKSKELYFIHFDWLTKCIDAVMDGTAEFMLYVNENRDKIFEDTINMQPNISPPIQLEQIKIAYIRAGDEPKEIQIEANKFDDETIKLIREAIESYQSENNIIVRLKFEDHLKRTTNVKFEKKKRDVWKVVRQIGSALYPMWRYKY